MGVGIASGSGSTSGPAGAAEPGLSRESTTWGLGAGKSAAATAAAAAAAAAAATGEQGSSDSASSMMLEDGKSVSQYSSDVCTPL